MPLSGMANIGLTVGLVALIWVIGAVLIKFGDMVEMRREAENRVRRRPHRA